MMLPDDGARRSSSQRLPVNPRRHKVAPEQRKRVATACNACNVRRVKCSGDRPCRQCKSASRECVYPTAVEKVTLVRSELDELRRKADLYDSGLRDGASSSAAPDSASVGLLQSAGSSPSFPNVSGSFTPSRGGYSLADGQSTVAVSPNKSEGSDDDQTAIEGRLLQDPEGTLRFLGETTEAVFLDHLKELLTSILPLPQHDAPSASDGGAFLSTMGSYATSDSQPLHSLDVDPRWLPSKPNMTAMLAELRRHVQDGNGDWPSGGIFWWGDLGALPSEPKASSPGGGLARFRSLAFHHAALAIVCHATTSHPPSAQSEPYTSEPFFARAKLLLENPLDVAQYTISDVGTLALMALYLVEMDRLETASMYVSAAMQVSVRHGVHRIWPEEKGRRVFWTLYVLDRRLSCLMGRAPMIMDEAIRIPLPSDVLSMPPAAGLRANVELSRIAGNILCNAYRVAPTDDNTGGPVPQLEKTVWMLQQWLAMLPPSLQLSQNGLSEDPAACLLHMGYNQLLILAIRPFFLAEIKKIVAERLVSPHTTPESHPVPYLRTCVVAAQRNIRFARHLLNINRPRRLLNDGLHAVYNAAICLVLQNLIYIEDAALRDPSLRDGSIDFAMTLLQQESLAGNLYAREGLKTLHGLRVVVARLRAPIDPSLDALEDIPSAGFDEEGEEMHQMQIERDNALYDELISWMEDDCQPYSNYPL